MLVQNSAVGRLQLDTALWMLYRHFNSCFRKDVLLFHNGDFSEEAQEEIRRRHGQEIQFRLLAVGSKYWQVPPDFREEDPRTWDMPEFSVGYRHMVRWNGILIFDYLRDMGYEWYMRLDDDSLILSCIDYDIFDFLDSHNYTYGYRLRNTEGKERVDTLLGLAEKHLFAKEERQVLLENQQSLTPSLIGPDLLCMYYNNFAVSKLSFWTSDRVRSWLELVDASGVQYRNRVGDAPLQSLTVAAFSPASDVYYFKDFSYRHQENQCQQQDSECFGLALRFCGYNVSRHRGSSCVP